MAKNKKDSTWTEVAHLLQGRPGWTVQSLSTPGSDLVWCLDAGGGVDLTVIAAKASINIFVLATEQDVTVDNVDGLVQWLDANRPGSLKDRPPGVGERLRRGEFFKW